MDTERDARIAVIIPVKGLDRAKSRTGLPPAARADLVLGLVQHTASAAAGCEAVGQVVVVTPDPAVASSVRSLGVTVLAEPAAGGLDAAARHGMAGARDRLGVRHAAVLMSDLPRLSVEDLDQVIAEYVERGVRLYVADQHGTGTTFLLQELDARPRTAFGPGSARRHEALGFRPAASPAPGLRFDVDTMDDLRQLDRQRVGTPA